MTRQTEPDTPTRPVTLPALACLQRPLTDDDAIERRERFLEHRTIKAGQECWRAMGRAESFDAWTIVGRALQVGRDHALRVTGANAPQGQRYCRAFSAWIGRHGFDKMRKSMRSVAIELAENAEAITAWRATLSERDRRRLTHPLSNVRRWRAATAQPHPSRPPMHSKPLPLRGVDLWCWWKPYRPIKPRRCGKPHKPKRLPI